MEPSILAKRGWLLVFFVITIFYFWGLGLLPLVGPDEPRYAEVAREMFARHDLITPTLGGLPWFEKPPLLYWLMMGGYRVLGVNEFAARLGPAICGLLTGVFVYWIGKTIEVAADDLESSSEGEHRGQDLGRYSALVWLSSVGAMVFSRGASFDIVVTMTVTGALACFFVWQARNEREGGHGSTRLPLLGFYLLVGLSLLAKGLIGIVIPGGVIGLYFLLRRAWPPRAFIKSLFWGIPLAFAVAAIWFGPMLARHGWKFFDQFIVQHHFARFVSNKYHHPAPFYYYLGVLVVLALPWTIFLGAAFYSARRWRWRGSLPIDRLRVFAFCWVLVPVGFFSLSESKLSAYILPALPGVALLAGERISCFLRAERGDLVLRLTGLLLIALVTAGGWYLVHQSIESPAWVWLGLAPMMISGLAALARPQLRQTLLILIPLTILLSFGIELKGAAPSIGRVDSVRDLLAIASARGYQATPVVQLHTIERAAEFYAVNRLTYGPDGEPVRLEGALQVAEAARQNGGLVLCFVPQVYETQLTSYASVRSEVIAGNGRVSLVAVRPK